MPRAVTSPHKGEGQIPVSRDPARQTWRRVGGPHGSGGDRVPVLLRRSGHVARRRAGAFRVYIDGMMPTVCRKSAKPCTCPVRGAWLPTAKNAAAEAIARLVAVPGGLGLSRKAA